MKIALLLFVAAVGVATEFGIAEAHSFPGDSPPVTTLNYFGVPVTCTPALFVYNPNIPDIAMTDFYDPVIRLNPAIIGAVPPNAQLFIVAHECGHVTLQTTDEDMADCWAAQTGEDQGWFGPSDFPAIAASLAGSGDGTHNIGPVRLAHILDCYQNNPLSQSDGLPHPPPSPTPT